VADCVEAYRGLHPDRRIEFERPPAPLQRRCAPDLLAQALDKLVENAISLTGEEDIVTVALEREDSGVSLLVCNTGSQLPDVPEGQLFDSLVSLREKSGGRHLGLGLHIVRLVAEAHGGSARARNLPGDEGVEFRIHLP